MSNLIINGKSYALKTDGTTMATIKKVISSVANARNIAKKDLRITLPNGRTISFKELDVFQDMVLEMNVGTFAGVDLSEECAEEAEKLKFLTKAAYNTPVSFNKLGSREESVFTEIANNTHVRLIESGAIEENFTKLIG